MRKILSKEVEGFLAENGKHYLPDVEADFTDEDWDAIPEKDKVLFSDVKPQVSDALLKEADNG